MSLYSTRDFKWLLAAGGRSTTSFTVLVYILNIPPLGHFFIMALDIPFIMLFVAVSSDAMPNRHTDPLILAFQTSRVIDNDIVNNDYSNDCYFLR